MTFRVPEQYRIRRGVSGSDASHGNNGVFVIPRPERLRGLSTSASRSALRLCVIASDGAGWEHVSVSLANQCPKWDDMTHVKSLFWSDDDCVVQYHPPKADYVNNHAFCLHLWRPIGTLLPRPPSILVGIAGIEL